jgi:asparagine synthase (glutamine-hydrolysing)
MDVDARARRVGHDFLYRIRPGERLECLTPVDYVGDWQAAEKALHGVETRDPTADIDVVSYCFGIPSEQYLAEDIDRSLVRRAMWGLLPEIVLTNRLRGLQSADWYEKVAARLDALAVDIAELTSSPLVRRAIDLDRLSRAIKNWPTSDWHTSKNVDEYNLALTRGVATARFLHWMESANDPRPVGNDPIR